MDDLINRQAAIDILDDYQVMVENGEEKPYAWARLRMSELPSAEPEPSIPISWIEKQIDWLKSMDNEFSNITAMNISALVKKWRKENRKDEQSD